jgi:PAS domain S-box-containing protein
MGKKSRGNIEKNILDNIPYLAWYKDADGRYTMVNEAFARAYHLQPDDIIGKTDFDLCTTEKALEFRRSDEEVIRSGEMQFIEQMEELSKGQKVFETYKTPIRNDQGRIIGISGISRDVSDSTWMEKTLREREEQISALLQNSSDAISIFDRKGIIIFESSEKNKITEYSKEELLNKPIFDTVHPDDVESIKLTFREALANPGRQIKKEYRSLHKNKRWIYVESIFSNQLNNPAIKGVIVNSRDISDRKMAELKERVYHDNLIFLSNSALELLGLSSKDQIYQYIPEKLGAFLESAVVVVSSFNEEQNRATVEGVSGIHPFEEDLEVLGKPLKGTTFSINNLQGFAEHAGTVVTLKDDMLEKGFGQITSENIKKLKEKLQVHKIYSIVLNRDNKLLGSITILTLNKRIIKYKHIIETFVHQVSVALHRSQLEYELVKAKDKAEESDKLKTAFLANMSHEIRTPMNGILGFAEMLNDNALSKANRKKYLQIINSNGKMLINLIDDIIDFAKIESDQVNILQDDFSLNNLLNQVQSSFLTSRLKRDKSRVRIMTKKSFPDEKSFIRTDPTRLRQVLTNLVGNAIKFTHKGFIEFGYMLEDSKTLLFYVKDTGIGIEEEKLQLIFERFMQADSSPSRKYGGSGLGLAISKGLVELLNGKMWAESVLNEGSTFYFTIPFNPVIRILDVSVENKQSRNHYQWEGRLFLIAEDDKFSYKFLEGFLKQTRAEVLRAADGREAVEICRTNPNIDLVLMDIQMPEMNGLVATEEIKKFNKNIPVIAQTANAISEERQRCLEAGCDDFITKPVNISELYAKINKWLSVKSPK